ncbi:hypothetical protein [Streptomyces tritici]|uniref:hypothetical protein n=1 Tax=Streptomyces tritici TaxID=2054410 RepID=UPI003AF12797
MRSRPGFTLQHGIDPNGSGMYDFGKGRSELAPKLPQEATAPASCGTIERHSGGSMGKNY